MSQLLPFSLTANCILQNHICRKKVAGARWNSKYGHTEIALSAGLLMGLAKAAFFTNSPDAYQLLEAAENWIDTSVTPPPFSVYAVRKPS